MTECNCHDPAELAKAITGLKIGGIAITWEEAWTLALDIIHRMHPQKGN